MAKNYYVVKVGRNPGIYETWDECKKQIEGFSNEIHKGFDTLEEDQEFLNLEDEISIKNKNEDIDVRKINDEIKEEIKNLKDDEVIAFVDGPYNGKTNISGYGAIIFQSNDKENRLCKSFSKNNVLSDFLKERNATAELEAAKDAIYWAIENKKNKIKICYDYFGIEKFITKEWKAKSPYSIIYVNFIENNRDKINITFKHTPSHKGIIYNEEVDKLAKSSLENKRIQNL